MITINKNKLSEKVSLTFCLDSSISLMGALMPIILESGQELNNISDTYITGETTSKLNYIKKSVKNGTDYLTGGANNSPLIILISGTNIKAKILSENKQTNEANYVLHVDTLFPIEYFDKDGITTFRFKPLKEFSYLNKTIFMVAYWGLIDEPKLDADVFMDRGVNNLFGDMKRMKTIKSVEEFKTTAFGYFKFYNGGFN